MNARISDFLGSRVFVGRAPGEAAVASSVDSADLPKNETPAVTESVLPERIIIDKIGVDSEIENPASRDVAVLDAALLKGVVRYPGSGGLTDNSNMLLFGHSTSYAVVHNQAYKALNRLSDLNIGDWIRLQSGGTEYLYKVSAVSEADKDKALIDLGTGEKMITLSTCDTFGQKSNRFVVEAKFIRSYPVRTNQD